MLFLVSRIYTPLHAEVHSYTCKSRHSVVCGFLFPRPIRESLLSAVEISNHTNVCLKDNTVCLDRHIIFYINGRGVPNSSAARVQSKSVFFDEGVS